MLPALAKMRRAGQSLGTQFGDLVLGLQLVAWPLTLATMAAAPAILSSSSAHSSSPPGRCSSSRSWRSHSRPPARSRSEALLAADRERVITRGAFRSQLGALVVIYPLSLVAGPVGTRASKILAGVRVLAYYYKAAREEFPEAFDDPRWPRVRKTFLVAMIAYALTPYLWDSVAYSLAWSTLVTLATGFAVWRLDLVPVVMADMVRQIVRRARRSHPGLLADD